MKTKKCKAQASMILIILVIFIIIGISVFLLSFIRTIDQSQYLSDYAHNLLLSVGRSDTGYDDSNCKTINDALACRFFTPSRTCGAGPTCKEVAEDSIIRYMNSFELISQNFRYLIIVRSAGTAHSLEPEIRIGNLSLETERTTKFTAIGNIQKVVSLDACNSLFDSWQACLNDGRPASVCQAIEDEYNLCNPGSHILKAQLILAKK